MEAPLAPAGVTDLTAGVTALAVGDTALGAGIAAVVGIGMVVGAILGTGMGVVLGTGISAVLRTWLGHRRCPPSSSGSLGHHSWGILGPERHTWVHRTADTGRRVWKNLTLS